MKMLLQSVFSNRIITYLHTLLVLPVPEVYLSDFDRSLRIINHRHLNVISLFGFILGFIFIILDLNMYLNPNLHAMYLSFLYMDMVPVIFLCISLFQVKHQWVWKLVSGEQSAIDVGHLYYFVLLMWTAVATSLAGIDHYHYLYFIITCVLGVILFYFKNFNIVFYYISALLVFFAVSWWRTGDIRPFDENQTMIYFVVLCILIARVRIFDKLSNYLEEKKVQEYIKELNDIKQELEDRVIDRIYDLAKMNEELKNEIKQRASLEEQLIHSQKMEAMGDLAGGIAYDFNNVLAIIQGFSELLVSDQALESETRKTVEKISMAADRGSQLVKQILLFSRKETEVYKKIDLCVVVEEAVSMIKVAAPGTVSILYENMLPAACIIGNSSNVHQLVLNVGINAIHAMQGNSKRRFDYPHFRFFKRNRLCSGWMCSVAG